MKHVHLISREISPLSASGSPKNFPCSRKRRGRIHERDIGTRAAGRANFCKPILWCQSRRCESGRPKCRGKLSIGSRACNRRYVRETHCHPRPTSHRAMPTTCSFVVGEGMTKLCSSSKEPLEIVTGEAPRKPPFVPRARLMWLT